MKQAFVESPVLQHFDPNLETVVETDALNFALGAMLLQRKTNKSFHPVAYFARAMTSAERNYEIYDKELLGIVAALRHWRTYLEGSKNPFLVQTDHKNLEYFTTTKILNQRQARWQELLSRYDYKIKYKAGSSNRADGLSRRPDFAPDRV